MLNSVIRRLIQSDLTRCLLKSTSFCIALIAVLHSSVVAEESSKTKQEDGRTWVKNVPRAKEFIRIDLAGCLPKVRDESRTFVQAKITRNRRF